MRNRSILRYGSLVLAVVLGMVASPQSADAQTLGSMARNQRQRALERFLILPPIPADLADSLYVIEFARELRSRLAGRVRSQVTIISTDGYCEALEASGFDCSFIPDANSALQLANFLRADSYTVSTFRRNSGPQLTIRMVDIGRSGIAGSVTVTGGTGDLEARDFARPVADSLRNQIRAAGNVRGCFERRDRADHSGGRERAERVFRDYPDHPSAAQCVADIFVVTEQPPDSMIWAYNKVVTGDPMNDRGWSELARFYFLKGDTVGAIESSEKRLNLTPQNAELRLQVVRMWQSNEEYDRALAVVDGGLELDPTNSDFIRFRARLCFDAQDWACTLEAFGAWYESDAQLANDSLFFVQVLGAGEFARDTAALMHWSEQAVQHFPNSLSFWGRRTALLLTTDDDEAVLEGYERLMALNPDEYRTKLAYVNKLVEAIVIDTAVPLDTAALMHADSVMTVIAEMAGDDENIKRSLAVIYYTPAASMAQIQLRPLIVMAWMEKSLGYDVTGQVTGPAKFFWGYMAYVHLGGRFDAVMNAESCEISREFDSMAKLGLERMRAGASISQSTADQLIPGLQQVSDVGTQFVDRDCSRN